jgi:hypothetical protein
VSTHRPGRWRLAGLALLAALAGPALAAPRVAADVALAQQRYEATAEHLRKRLGQPRDLDEETKERLKELRFVYLRSALVEVRNERRFGATRVVVSDGWFVLAEDLLRAHALSAEAKRPGCLSHYARAALAAARTNLERTAQGRRALIAPPRLDAFLAAAAGRRGDACQGLWPGRLQRPAIEQSVAAGLDAMLVWLIARQITLHDPAMATAACPARAADEAANAYAARAGVDLAPAAAAVRAHAALGLDGMAVPCITGAQRFDAYAERWLDAPRRAALDEAWPAD